MNRREEVQPLRHEALGRYRCSHLPAYGRIDGYRLGLRFRQVLPWTTARWRPIPLHPRTGVLTLNGGTYPSQDNLRKRKLQRLRHQWTGATLLSINDSGPRPSQQKRKGRVTNEWAKRLTDVGTMPNTTHKLKKKEHESDEP